MTDCPAAPAPPRSVRQRIRRTIRIGWPVLIVAAALLAPLAWEWLSGRTLVHRDSAMVFAPQRWLAGTALRALRLPLWNPYAGTGMPFLAQTMHGVLHPLSIAVAFAFPGDGLDPLLGAYVLAAGMGAAALARCLGASWLASTAAAFAFGLSGYTLSMTGFLVHLAGAASLPWMVAGPLLAARERTPSGFAAGAVCVAACSLSGDVEVLVVGGLLGLCFAYEAARLPGLVRAVASAGAGALLAGVQLVPSWSFFRISSRAQALSADELKQWALSPWRLVELAAPGFFSPPHAQPMSRIYLALGGPTAFGAPFARSIFVGAPVLVLAAFALRSSRRTRLLGASAAALAWVALGHHLGAQQLLSMVPMVQGFRYSEKLVGPLVLCLSSLAALGIDRLAAEPALARRAARVTAGLAAAAAVAWLAVAAAHRPAGASAPPRALLQTVTDVLATGIAYPATGLAVLAAVLAFARRSPTAFTAAIAAVVWSESAIASSYALDAGSPDARLRSQAPALAAPPPGPRVLTPFEAGHRMLASGWDFQDLWAFQNAALLSPSFNVRHGIDSVGIDSSILPARYREVRDLFAERWGLAARSYGVTHVLLDRDEKPPSGGALVGTDPLTGTAIWIVPHRDWASFPPAVERASGREAAAAALLRLRDGGSAAAVVETEAPLAASSGRIRAVTRERERVRIEAEASDEAVLVVNDAYAPGWRASIDGGEVPIYPADVLVRAVPWPAGRHTLVMEYDPPEVTAGLWTSFAGALVVAGALVLAGPFAALRRARRRPRSEPPPRALR